MCPATTSETALPLLESGRGSSGFSNHRKLIFFVFVFLVFVVVIVVLVLVFLFLVVLVFLLGLLFYTRCNRRRRFLLSRLSPLFASVLRCQVFTSCCRAILAPGDAPEVSAAETTASSGRLPMPKRAARCWRGLIATASRDGLVAFASSFLSCTAAAAANFS